MSSIAGGSGVGSAGGRLAPNVRPVRFLVGVVGALALLLVACAPASADFNAPKAAGKMTVNFVTGYEPCAAPTLTHPISTTTMPACSPRLSSAKAPANTYTFGKNNGKDDGFATMTLRVFQGHSVKASFKSRSIYRNGTIYTGSALRVSARLRATDHGCGPGSSPIDCTIVDYTAEAGLSCTHGSCVLSDGRYGLEGLPPGGGRTNIELYDIRIHDEDGDTVATPGLLMPGPGGNAFSAPRQASTLHVDMVTAYNECTSGNLTHGGFLVKPACGPPQPSAANYGTHVTTFGPGGSASVDLKAVRGDVKMSVRGKSILQDGVPYSGTDLIGAAVLRVTDNACGAGEDTDCTMVDFWVPIPLGPCLNGVCKGSPTNFNAVLPDMFSGDEKTNVAIDGIRFYDHQVDVFARSGLLPTE